MFRQLFALLLCFGLVSALPLTLQERRGGETLLTGDDRRSIRPRAGMQHKHKATYPPNAHSPFRPVPEHYYYATETGVYSGKQVNQAAGRLMNDVQSARPWNKKHSPQGYPKPSTGFRNNDPNNPAGPGDVAYHTPIKGNVGPGAKPGPDRLYAHRPPTAGSQYKIGVSYHDSSKQIPPPSSNGRAATNHPFTAVKPWKTPFATVNKVGAHAQRIGLKAKVKVQGATSKVKKAASVVKGTVKSMGTSIKAKLPSYSKKTA